MGLGMGGRNVRGGREEEGEKENIKPHYFGGVLEEKKKKKEREGRERKEKGKKGERERRKKEKE